MTPVSRWLTYGLLIYVLALHISIAAMEISVWALCLTEMVLFSRRKSLPSFPEWKPILGLFLCVFISLVLNPGGRGFIFQIGFLRWAIILYLLPGVLREAWNEEFERKLIIVWSIACSVSAVYALFQTFTGIDLVRPAAHVVSFSHGIYRPVGFFSRSLAFAYSFGLSFFFLSIPVVRRFPKWASITFLFLGTATIVATEARGAWIGFVIAVMFYLACEHRKYLTFFVIALVAGVALLSQSSSDIGIKINFMLSGSLDHSASMRSYLWMAYWQMFKSHPFFGVGLFQGDLLVPEIYKQMGITEEFVSNAHNTFLQWLAGAGIFALGFFLWLVFSFLRRAWLMRRRSSWGWSIFMAQIFLFVGAFTENNFFTAITNHMLILGWSILLLIDSQKDG